MHANRINSWKVNDMMRTEMAPLRKNDAVVTVW